MEQDETEYQRYYDITMEIMQREFEYYEQQYQKILDRIGISPETFDMSKELYIAGEGAFVNEDDYLRD